MRVHALRENVAGDADGDRTIVRDESVFHIANGIGEQEFHAVGLRFSGLESQAGGRIPGLGFLPFIFGEGLAVNHPIVKTFEGYAARSRVGENCWRGGGLRVVENWIVGFERSLAIGDHQQRGAVSVEARHLQVAGVFADVGIVEDAERMGLFE